jgi:hypothetical protein
MAKPMGGFGKPPNFIKRYAAIAQLGLQAMVIKISISSGKVKLKSRHRYDE